MPVLDQDVNLISQAVVAPPTEWAQRSTSARRVLPTTTESAPQHRIGQEPVPRSAQPEPVLDLGGSVEEFSVEDPDVAYSADSEGWVEIGGHVVHIDRACVDLAVVDPNQASAPPVVARAHGTDGCNQRIDAVLLDSKFEQPPKYVPIVYFVVIIDSGDPVVDFSIEKDALHRDCRSACRSKVVTRLDEPHG